MSYQLGYEPQSAAKSLEYRFKCMSYQLGYELGKRLFLEKRGFKCMSYQLGYEQKIKKKKK